MANRRPSAPTNAKINGHPESDGYASKSTGSVKISAKINDPDAGQRVRLVVRYSTTTAFTTYSQKVSDWHAQGTSPTVTLYGLSQNVRYYVRLYTQDIHGLYSASYNSLNFWTNRKPSQPEVLLPPDNLQSLNILPITFKWKHIDLDDDKQVAWQIQWRALNHTGRGSVHPGTPPPGSPIPPSFPHPDNIAEFVPNTGWDFLIGGYSTTSDTFIAPAKTFQSNQFYEWEVRTRDPQKAWGDWSVINSFYISGFSTPPVLLYPVNGTGVDVSLPTTFDWRFLDPDPGDSQSRADLRWRPVGSAEAAWQTRLGDTTTPGGATRWIIPADTFQPGFHYEWSARTYDTLSGGDPSDWRDAEDFYTMRTPGSGISQPLIPAITEVQGALGLGHHRVFIYDKGGMIPRGEITGIASIQWSRNRDDISSCLLSTTGLDPDTADLLANLHCWQHEVVVFRNDDRVWEGPITRITYSTDVQIEAKDVMAWVFRRIMRQGYNDAHRVVDGVQLGLKTVVRRAAMITIDALVRDDPNVLPYLTLFEFPDDARQSRVVPDFSRTAWEEIDDLAATAGLDYTVIGRRICYWDTHRSIGRIPEMRDGDFLNPPIVSEYGMLLANRFGVTNGNGVWGEAFPLGEAMSGEFYGVVEQLATAYGEADGASEDVLTAQARAALVATMEAQAQRNIGGRWPAPVIVRVPDNTALDPTTNVGINQLVPGVWIPLRSTGTLRSVSQWQKLDSVTVNESDGEESVAVVLSPAPNQGQDPDADLTIEEG